MLESPYTSTAKATSQTAKTSRDLAGSFGKRLEKRSLFSKKAEEMNGGVFMG